MEDLEEQPTVLCNPYDNRLCSILHPSHYTDVFLQYRITSKGSLSGDDWILSAIIYLIIYQVVELGLVGISLEFRDGNPHEIEDLFKNYRLFPNFLAATIIYGFMVAIGFILLIVPGIYLALKYMFYGYLIVDKGLGPIEALKESGRMTQGAKKNIIVYWLTLWCGMIVIMLILGLFVAAPAGFIY
jgi:uncharacterized membrane protein